MFKLQWHSADPKYFKLWERQIGRKNFKVTKNTTVCSNHFVFGKPLGEHLHPELSATLNVNAAEVIDSWSNGAKEDESVYKTTRRGTIKRKVTTTTTTRKGTIKRKAAHTLSTPITKRVKGKHDTDGSESSSFN